MKKVDFHIHTIASESDAYFEFSLDRLVTYISQVGLDAIAITNHNLFNRNQFTEILNVIDIPCFPGIEIDIESAQILLLSDGSDLDDFEKKCKLIEDHFESNSISVTVSELKQIFGELSDYIIIPHYDKKPAIKEETLHKLSPFITAGEVSSPKKFVYSMKDADRLVPVYFSDCRISDQLVTPTRQTFINCDCITFASIRNCLRDKNKVALSRSDGHSLFQVFDDGQMLSTGLNVIVGERSSGKSYTLTRLKNSFDNVKFIEQFSIVARNEEEDQRKFNEHLSQKHSLLSRDYLQELNRVVDDVLDIDLAEDERKVEVYLDTLLKHAGEIDKQDAFSRAVLYREELFPDLDQTGLKQLISSTKNLIRNEEFHDIVTKHLDIQALHALYVELMLLFTKQEADRRKKIWVNDLVRDVKSKLQIRTAAPTISEMDMYKIALNLKKIDKFSKLVKAAQESKEISRKPLQGFEIVATAGRFSGAGELKKLSKSQVAFSEAYKNYAIPYEYLKSLKSIDDRIPPTDYYRYFVKIEYKILKDGIPASGGQRSEFFLLQAIMDAQNYDMLLIDEPESSFDNLFLLKEVNSIIKNLSKDMPVVVVTHNNTIGASIQPDYLLCTKRETEGNDIRWRIYSGYPANSTLTAVDGGEISTFDTFLDSLEGGEVAYKERNDSYENIKD